MRVRDTQRSKLYRAEAVLHKWKKPLPSVDDVVTYVIKVFGSKRVAAAFPTVALSSPPRVKDGRGNRSAKGGTYHISIPRWARNDVIVLHELAHTITRRAYPINCAGHGWQFCATYLKLLLYFIGREAHDALKAEMKATRVRFRPPRKSVPLSPERREQMIAVLAAARERRKSDGRPGPSGVPRSSNSG